MDRVVIFRSVAACMGALRDLPGGYMISRPIPRAWMDAFGLVMIPYDDSRGVISDLLIHPTGHKLYEAEAVFIREFSHAYWDIKGTPLE